MFFGLDVRKHFMSKNDHFLSISWGWAEVALRARNKKSGSVLGKNLLKFLFLL